MKRRDVLEKVARVESEFGESFDSVLLGLARDGESMHGAARVLGFCHKTIIAYVRANGWESKFAGKDSAAARALHRDMIGRDCSHMSACRGATRVTIDGIDGKISEHAKRAGVNLSTVRSRMRRGLSVSAALAPEMMYRTDINIRKNHANKLRKLRQQ